MPSVPTSAAHFFPDDDLPPPDGGDTPWCPAGEEHDPTADLLIWWMPVQPLSRAAGSHRLPGTTLYGRLNQLPDDLLEEMEDAACGALGTRPRVIGLHRARLKSLPVRDTSPLWDAQPYHLWWGFVIESFYRPACADIGGRFTTLQLEPVS